MRRSTRRWRSRRPAIRRAALAAFSVTCLVVGLASVPAHATGTIYTVLNTSDCRTPGCGSLWAAIDGANRSKGADAIVFAILGTGVKTITPGSDLPAITDPVLIDGYQQAGAARATATSPATLTVVINAVNMSNGLLVQSNATVISGVVVENASGTTGPCPGAGICVVGDHNILSGDYVGVDETGAARAADLGDGVHVVGGDNWVGGPNPGDRNVISGNRGDGVVVDGSDNHVLSNRIGTSADGETRVGNGGNGVRLAGGAGHVGAIGDGNLISANLGNGILVGPAAGQSEILANSVGVDAAARGPMPNAGSGLVVQSNNNTIGGTVAGAGNVLSGNQVDGLRIDDPATGNTVQGNLIGSAPGPARIPNGRNGVTLNSGAANTIGGTVAGAGNTISGNLNDGIWLPGDDQVIQGNLVGVVDTGTGVLAIMPNNVDGIEVIGVDNTIGGTVAGAGNTIAGNLGNGVFVQPAGVDDSILGNAIYGNAVPQILVPAGPAAPVLGAAAAGVSITTVNWTLRSAANTSFWVEFFNGSAACDARTYLGGVGVRTNAMGNAVFVPPAGSILGVASTPGTVIATATTVTAAGAFAATSQFSNCVPV
jgi:hypothetical protein